MKCQYLVVISIHAKTAGLTSFGLSGAGLVTELNEARDALEKKYSARKQQVLQVEILIDVDKLSKECDGTMDALPDIPLSSDQEKKLRGFTNGSADVGLYLLAHYTDESTHFSRAFDGQVLGLFVNKLPFEPRKICIVACNAGRDKASDVLDFCKHLKKKNRPLVAAYHYPVYVAAAGHKLFQPKRQSAEKKVSRSELTPDQAKSFKKYFQHNGTQWVAVTYSDYHDKEFGFA